MKVKFIKSPTGVGFAYFTGDTVVLADKLARELIADGIAEEIKEVKSAQKSKGRK